MLKPAPIPTSSGYLAALYSGEEHAGGDGEREMEGSSSKGSASKMPAPGVAPGGKALGRGMESPPGTGGRLSGAAGSLASRGVGTDMQSARISWDAGFERYRWRDREGCVGF